MGGGRRPRSRTLMAESRGAWPKNPAPPEVARSTISLVAGRRSHPGSTGPIRASPARHRLGTGIARGRRPIGQDDKGTMPEFPHRAGKLVGKAQQTESLRGTVQEALLLAQSSAMWIETAMTIRVAGREHTGRLTRLCNRRRIRGDAEASRRLRSAPSSSFAAHPGNTGHERFN